MEDTRGVKAIAMEVVTALVLAAMGAVAVWDSRRIGAGWNEDGPQSGYFLFWIGLLLMAASLGTLVQAIRPGPGRDAVFVTWPPIVYVVAIPVLGIYVASALLVAYCMVALGGFAWWVAGLSGIATAVVVFVTFELWFLVALPKGPIEELLGLQ